MDKSKYVFKNLVFNAGNIHADKLVNLHVNSDQIVMTFENGQIFGMKIDQEPWSNGSYILENMDGQDIYNYINTYKNTHSIFELCPSLKEDYDTIQRLLEEEKIEFKQREQERQKRKIENMNKEERKEYDLFLELKKKYGNI